MRRYRRGLGLKARAGIIIGMVFQRVVILSLAVAPGSSRLVLSLAAGFILATVGLALLGEGYDAVRKRR